MSTNYEPTQEQFAQCVANWSMEALRDDGLYRHLRFRVKGGGFTYFDIVTWPDRLVITGDCKTFTFTRMKDMFDFFRGAKINPGYWQEKIIDGRERAESFDWDRFRAAALADFDEATEDEEDAERRAEARQDLESELDGTDADEYGATQLLREYCYRPDGYGSDPYFRFNLFDGAPDGKGWDFHYIWCCRAIVFAIEQYDAQRANSA